MTVFPDAKVVLTTRPAAAWYHSMYKAIIEPRGFLERPPISWAMEEVRERASVRLGMNHTTWSAVEAGRDTAIAFFEDWERMVVSKVPKERLLVFQASQGWEPLCQFLGLPVPDEPFPRINDSWTIEWIVKGSYYLIVIGIPLVVVVSVVCCRRRRTKGVNGGGNGLTIVAQRWLGKLTFPFVYVYDLIRRRFQGYSIVKTRRR